jgi:hypothetical protein
MGERLEAISRSETDVLAFVSHSFLTGIFDLLPLLERLTTIITHLMVEGGAKVISSFLTSPKNVVDLVIVTVAPVFVGNDGIEATPTVRPSPSSWLSPVFLEYVLNRLIPLAFVSIHLSQKKGEALPELVHLKSGQFGKDTVLVCKLRHRERFA